MISTLAVVSWVVIFSSHVYSEEVRSEECCKHNQTSYAHETLKIGENMNCDLINHQVICSCHQGYVGDPLTGCGELMIYDDNYTYYPLPSPVISFKVKTREEVKIQLLPKVQPSNSDTVIEIILGSASNTMSSIRKMDKYSDYKVEIETEGILSSNITRGFWITYIQGIVAVGIEDEIAPFMRWRDPAPVQMTHTFFTNQANGGEWIIDGKTFHIRAKNGVMRPMPHFSLDFSVKTGRNAHIALTTGPNKTMPMYEFILGGWGNMKSAFRINNERKVLVDTSELLSTERFTHFRITWDDGTVRVITGGKLMIEWEDMSPFIVSHVGIRGNLGSSPGIWNIKGLIA